MSTSITNPWFTNLHRQRSKPAPIRYYFRTGIILSLAVIILLPTPTYSYQHQDLVGNYRQTTKPVYVSSGQLVISPHLQQQIAAQIPEFDRLLTENFRLFSIPIHQQIGFRYFHQGRSKWKIQITYGGYPVVIDDETLYNTSEIFDFKQAAILTKSIEIAGRSYATNGSMQQIGPIWHERGVKC
jgi:hypothetical protein